MVSAHFCLCILVWWVRAVGDQATPIDLAKLQTLPSWAQDVVRTGCFEGAPPWPLFEVGAVCSLCSVYVTV